MSINDTAIISSDFLTDIYSLSLEISVYRPGNLSSSILVWAGTGVDRAELANQTMPEYLSGLGDQRTLKGDSQTETQREEYHTLIWIHFETSTEGKMKLQFFLRCGCFCWKRKMDRVMDFMIFSGVSLLKDLKLDLRYWGDFRSIYLCWASCWYYWSLSFSLCLFYLIHLINTEEFWKRNVFMLLYIWMLTSFCFQFVCIDL